MSKNMREKIKHMSPEEREAYEKMQDFVCAELGRYHAYVDRRASLKEKLARIKEAIDGDDLIEAMSYQTGDNMECRNDRTAYIALHYQEKMEQMQKEYRDDLCEEYCALDYRIHFLECGIQHLDGNAFDALDCLVLQGMTWDSVTELLGIARTTLKKWRAEAFNGLTDYYLRHWKPYGEVA